MRSCSSIFLAVLLSLLVSLSALAAPVPGTYVSTSRPGAHPGVQIGRASTSRQSPNSGNPKVFDGQSWSGSALGAQWEIKCGVEVTPTPPDYSLYNAGTGTGLITYHQTFQGGTFALYADPAVGWGSGAGTLNTTSVVSQVQMINFMPVSSSFTAATSGRFDAGCDLAFAMGNGFGVGETSDPPYLTKPATYPAFLAADCSLADGSHQFGTWGDVNDIIVSIGTDCLTPSHEPTWGAVKSIYR
jgi:hypothetical protein